jgi:hypothetical protein
MIINDEERLVLEQAVQVIQQAAKTRAWFSSPAEEAHVPAAWHDPTARSRYRLALQLRILLGDGAAAHELSRYPAHAEEALSDDE